MCLKRKKKELTAEELEKIGKAGNVFKKVKDKMLFKIYKKYK